MQQQRSFPAVVMLHPALALQGGQCRCRSEYSRIIICYRVVISRCAMICARSSKRSF
jgi:hypothetical protein